LNGEIIWIDKKLFEKEIHMICLLVVREKRKRKRKRERERERVTGRENQFSFLFFPSIFEFFFSPP
jgi:hypothetical protein